MSARPATELTALYRYPVKSCRGQSLSSAVVEPWGLAGDRRWMVVDTDGAELTSRVHPRLVLTRPERVGDRLRLRHADLPDLDVPVPSRGSRSTTVTIWGNAVHALVADGAAADWFSTLLGLPARLVYLDDPTQRRPNPQFSALQDRVGFADAYPLLLASEESLAALNDLVAAGPLAGEGPLEMRRFRPNVVVRGAPPWSEDGWRRVRIGSVEFRVVKGCDRCVLTTVDPNTAAKGREPLATLARYRRFDGRTWFGVQLALDAVAHCDGGGPTLTVGDEVTVLESVPAPDGPLR